MEDQGLVGAVPIRDFRDVPEGLAGSILAVWALEHGFEGKGVTVISEQDVSGRPADPACAEESAARIIS